MNNITYIILMKAYLIITTQSERWKYNRIRKIIITKLSKYI